jgi:hypothetical protein
MPYLRSYMNTHLIRRPQRVSDDDTKTNRMHSVRMYGWLNWCWLRYSSGFMNTIIRPRLGYMKGEEFVDLFNKENSAPWNQYSRKRLREKQGKQITPTRLMCCLNSVPPPPSLPPLISFMQSQTRRQSSWVLWTYQAKLTPTCLSYSAGMEICGREGAQLRISGENWLFIHWRTT